MKHALFTNSDTKCEDFLVEHWLRSLKDNVDLSNIDVICLDYGISDHRRRQLEEEGVIVRPCVRDAWIGNLYLRDMAATLEENEYDQAVIIDGGDVIFQADISHLFEQDKDTFRGVQEDNDSGTHRFFVTGKDFTPEKWQMLMDYLTGKPMINGSSVMAPSAKYRELWYAFLDFSESREEHASNQVFLNYYLYEHGFVKLPRKYNFICQTAAEKFTIKNGVFYNSTGEIIPVVHNAGAIERYRVVGNFGYGEGHNKKKPFTYRMRQLQCNFASWWVRHRYAKKNGTASHSG